MMNFSLGMAKIARIEEQRELHEVIVVIRQYSCEQKLQKLSQVVIEILPSFYLQGESNISSLRLAANPMFSFISF